MAEKLLDLWQMERWPRTSRGSLRAWDAADEYLLRHLETEDLLGTAPRLLIIGDAFGALAMALHESRPVLWNDSLLCRLALEKNLRLNGLAADHLLERWVPGDRKPDGPFDLVLLKLPKALAWLQEVLHRLRPLLAPGARVVSGGMIKYSPKAAYELLAAGVGATTTSRGWKKARLAFSTVDQTGEGLPAVAPASWHLPDDGLDLVTWPGVFSHKRLDPGTRLLLKNLPRSEAPLKVADLGCGNGVLALALARRCPQADILGVDASYQAVACASGNLQGRADLARRRIAFAVADGLGDQPEASLDLVVCNPPFHQDQAVGDQVAWRMFRQAHRSLTKGGRLLIVGNRHLGYHVKLGRLFDSCRTVASDDRFVILSARR